MDIQEYRTLLNRIGINAQLDTNFLRLNARYGNLFLVFEHNNSDPFYFRIVLPVVADDSDGTNVTDDIINRFNVEFKATKIIKQGTQYHIVSEQYVFDYSTLELVIKRVIAIMENEIFQFHERIKPSI